MIRLGPTTCMGTGPQTQRHRQRFKTTVSVRVNDISLSGMLSSNMRKPLSLTATFLRRYRLSSPLSSSTLFPSSCFFSSSAPTNSSAFADNDSATKDSAASTQCSELTRLATLVEGCDYEHWLVVMERPKGYPLRDEIVSGYIQTLAMALGSEEEAKKSIYSVSTKYYFAFGCKVPENLTFKIKSLPNVRWVLPDSYLCHGENDYGGEPLVDGVAVPYDEMYHAEWLRDENDNKYDSRTCSKKA